MIDDDALDRALFALPLATPPGDLRAAILRATIDAPEFAPVMSTRDILLMGVAAAIGVWLLMFMLGDHRNAEAFARNAYSLTQLFGNLQTLSWLAAGTAVAGIVAMFPETLDLRIHRGRRQA